MSTVTVLRLTDRRGDRSAADFFSQAATQYTTADDDTCFYYYDNSHAETEDNEPQGFPRDAKGKTDSVTTAAGSFPTESNKSRPNYYVENKGISWNTPPPPRYKVYVIARYYVKKIACAPGGIKNISPLSWEGQNRIHPNFCWFFIWEKENTYNWSIGYVTLLNWLRKFGINRPVLNLELFIGKTVTWASGEFGIADLKLLQIVKIHYLSSLLTWF